MPCPHYDIRVVQRDGERADWTSRGKLKGTVADYNRVQAAMDFLPLFINYSVSYSFCGFSTFMSMFLRNAWAKACAFAFLGILYYN